MEGLQGGHRNEEIRYRATLMICWWCSGGCPCEEDMYFGMVFEAIFNLFDM